MIKKSSFRLVLVVFVAIFSTGLLAFAKKMPTNSQRVPFSIEHEKGSFEGELHISVKGRMRRVTTTVEGAIKNKSPHKIYRAIFCISAFDDNGMSLNRKDEACFFTLLGSWGVPGEVVHFDTKQKFQLVPKSKEVVSISKYTVEAIKVLEHAPNLRHIKVSCPLVWSSMIQVFADRNFHPKVLEKDSYIANFSYEGGQIQTEETLMHALKTYTTADTSFFGPNWAAFRIDTASVYLRNIDPGVCRAEIKMSFSASGAPMGTYDFSWFDMSSTLVFESNLLDEIERLSKQANDTDMDRAISQLPEKLPEPPAAELPKLTITSEPTGAEIEINGEWIGNTPTKLQVEDGKSVLKVTLSGYQVWERTLRLRPGDERTIRVGLTKEP